MKHMEQCRSDEDPARLRDFLLEHGYLYLKNAFDRRKVRRVRTTVVDTLVRHQWATQTDGKLLPLLPIRTVGSDAFCRCEDELMSHEDLHLLATDRAFTSLLEAIVGFPLFAHPRKMTRIGYPIALNSTDRVPPHQDFYYVRGGCDTFTAWIPLGDYGVRHGGLEVLDGSHTRGLYPTKPIENRYHCNAVMEEAEAGRWRFSGYRMGDVLVFHALTVHESGKNDSTEMRISLDCRHSARDQAINSDELLPPYYPRVRSWQDLSAGWTNKNLFDPPPGLQTEDPGVHPSTLLHRSRFLKTAVSS
jgi:hypothetical protein